jgi:hypothetical protein
MLSESVNDALQCFVALTGVTDHPSSARSRYPTNLELGFYEQHHGGLRLTQLQQGIANGEQRDKGQICDQHRKGAANSSDIN